jgi:hypothetical protein
MSGWRGGLDQHRWSVSGEDAKFDQGGQAAGGRTTTAQRGCATRRKAAPDLA